MRPSSASTAAILIIGNEILSGKTQDTNVRHIGGELAKLGIVLKEAKIVRDDLEQIVREVNAYRETYTYVFTTGGIGPTHDDITADAIARAFDVELELNEEAVRLIGSAGLQLTEPRLKMARIPVGAALIENTVSRAPGFRMENVFVLAGVPSIAQAMFESLKGQLEGGAAIHSANVDVLLRESEIAGPLEDIAQAHPDIEIGSYPFSREGVYGANLVVRGTDRKLVDAVLEEIIATMRAEGAETRRTD